jgi:F-type H+-transporting ATPase subunit delta
MNEGLISRRYALALFKYAGEQKIQRLIYWKMIVFQKNYDNYPDLQKALLNPVLSPESKIKLLATAVGIEPEDVYMQAIRLLVKNHREMYMKPISLTYQRIYREFYGIVDVKVTTAVELTQEMKEKIRAVVKARTTKKTEFIYEINPDLIGGMILEMDGQQYDASISRKLKDIRTEFLSSPSEK